MDLARSTHHRFPVHGFALLTVAILLGQAAPLAAQAPAVRRSFSYVGDQITIVVRSEAAGRLRLLHGGLGRIDVYAAASGGTAVPSLGGRFGDELTLATLGGDRTDWIVAAPPEARVRVRLPGVRDAATFAAPTDAASFAWKAHETAGPPAPEWAEAVLGGTQDLPAPEPSALSVVYVLGSTTAVPKVLKLTGVSSLRSVTVRLGPPRFRVLADRPLNLEPSSDRGFALDSGARAARLTIEVPADAGAFALYFDAAAVLKVADGEIRARCPNAVRQTAPDHRQWITFADPVACVGPEGRQRVHAHS